MADQAPQPPAGTVPGGDKTASGEAAPPAGTPAPPEPTAAQAAWFDSLTPADKAKAKAWHDAETAPLANAYQSEHERRKTQSQELTAAIAKAEGAEKVALQAAQEKIAAADARADFRIDAIKAGCVDDALAWLVVEAEQLYDRRGNPDLETLREKHPALFAAAPPAPNARGAAGTNQPAGASFDLNAAMRKAAGG